MAVKEKNGIEVKFGADCSELGKALNTIDKQAKAVNTDITNINKALKFDRNNLSLLSEKFSKLSDSIEITKKRLKELKDRQKEYEDLFKSGKIDNGQYAAFQNEIRQTEIRLVGLKKQANQTAETLTQQLRTAAASVKEDFITAAKVISAAETALVGFSANAVKSVMDFDKAMSNVAAISGASEEEFSALTEKAKELGEDTVYSASQVADALGYMALAGWDTQSMMEGISPVLTLAAASAMDLGTASDIVTDYLTAFGLKAEDAANFVDIMAYAMSNSNTTTQLLGEAYKNCAATAASFGYSVEETTAILMTMSNAGVKGSEAGTALNAIMTRLATDTKGCAGELAKLGVNIYDVEGNMNSLSDILEGMSGIWADLTDKEQANLAKAIAGTNQYAELQTIMTGCSEAAKEGGQSFSDYAAALKNCTGTAENMSETMIDNLSGDLTILKSSFEGLQIAISDKLTPSLRGAAQEGTNAFSALTEEVKNGELSGAFEKLGDSVSRLIKNGFSVAAQELPKIINLLTYIIEHANKIIGLMVALKSAAALKKIITDVSAVATAFVSFANTVRTATTAQEAFNAVSSANAIGAIATALAVVIGAFTTYVLSVDSAVEETVKLTDSQRESIAAVNELTDSLNESKKARKDAAQAIEEEYSGYQALTDKLYKLNDAESLTIEQKAEMHSLVEKLNKAIPELNLSIDEETGRLNKQKQAVDELIQSKKNYAVVNSAINNLAELEIEKEKAQKVYDEAFKKHAEAEKISDAAQKAVDDYQENPNPIPGERKDIKRLQELDAEAKSTLKTTHELAGNLYDASIDLKSVNSEIEINEDILSKNSDIVEEVTEKNNSLTDSLEDTADATSDLSDEEDTLAKRFETAKTKISSTRSSLADYLSILKQINDGTAYTTSQMLELIEKYPELAGAIQLTRNGYILEKEAVEELVKAKADKLKQDSFEALQLAEQQYWEVARSGHATSEDENEAYQAWRRAKGYYDETSRITATIKEGHIIYSVPEGNGGSDNYDHADGTPADTTDYWKQAAESEISEAEHLYNMGEISAEDYYNRLADINRRYYESKAEYLSEYNDLAEKVYSGLKQAQEDDLSNAKELEERIRSVTEAENKLKNADKQEVSVYSSAAGFHSEKNTSAISEAQQDLHDARYSLAQTLLKLGKFDGSGISAQLGSLNTGKLKNMLPDLSKLSVPTSLSSAAVQPGTAAKSFNITVNYTSGDIILQGKVDEVTVARVKRLMETEFKELFLKCLNDYLNQLDLDRMTGG